MNERIKELALQAGMQYCYNDMYDDSEFDYKKFAELIVKETMQVVSNQLPSNQYLDVAHAVIEHYKEN